MRQIMLGDLVAVARTVLCVPFPERDLALRRIIRRAHIADKIRKRMGLAHKDWGNGSLMAAVAQAPKQAEPFCSDIAYLEALRATIEEILTWKKQNQRLNRQSGAESTGVTMDDSG